jgi:hypothetical protein
VGFLVTSPDAERLLAFVIRHLGHISCTPGPRSGALGEQARPDDGRLADGRAVRSLQRVPRRCWLRT